jgi:hypothetical protein
MAGSRPGSGVVRQAGSSALPRVAYLHYGAVVEQLPGFVCQRRSMPRSATRPVTGGSLVVSVRCRS